MQLLSPEVVCKYNESTSRTAYCSSGSLVFLRSNTPRLCASRCYSVGRAHHWFFCFEPLFSIHLCASPASFWPFRRPFYSSAFPRPAARHSSRSPTSTPAFIPCNALSSSPTRHPGGPFGTRSASLMAPAAHPRKPRAPPPGTGGHTPPSAPPPPPHSAHQPLIATVVESALRSLPPVASYDPAVVPALVDALLADAAALLTDARAYASHAGRADLAAEDVRLAVDGCARGGAGGVGATPGGTTPDGAPLPGAGGGVHPLDLAALARVVNATPLPLCRAAGGGWCWAGVACCSRVGRGWS